MNSVFSQGQDAASLHQNLCSVSKQLAMSNLTTMEPGYYTNESMMDFLITPLSSAISDHSLITGTPKTIKGWLMSLPQASHVSRSVLPENNSQKTTQDMEQARFTGNGNRPKYRDCFPTPTVNDSKNNNPPSQKNRNTPPLNSVVNGQLNPDWVEWLMAWPIGWSDLKPLTELKWLDPSVDPHPDIPRTTDKTENRVNRLKAIGNGQVPKCAAIAWEVLR